MSEYFVFNFSTFSLIWAILLLSVVAFMTFPLVSQPAAMPLFSIWSTSSTASTRRTMLLQTLGKLCGITPILSRSFRPRNISEPISSLTTSSYSMNSPSRLSSPSSFDGLSHTFVQPTTDISFPEASVSFVLQFTSISKLYFFAKAAPHTPA